MCDKRDRAIICMLCRDLYLTSLFSGLLQKVWRKVSSTKLLSRCHARFLRLLSSSADLLRKFTNNTPRKSAAVHFPLIKSSGVIIEIKVNEPNS